MPTRKILQLDEDRRAQLQHIVKRGSYWRERERAQTTAAAGLGRLC